MGNSVCMSDETRVRLTQIFMQVSGSRDVMSSTMCFVVVVAVVGGFRQQLMFVTVQCT